MKTDEGSTLVAFRQNNERVSDAGEPGTRTRLVWDPQFNVVFADEPTLDTERARHVKAKGSRKMSEPDRVSLAFIWDTKSPRFSRRTFMGTMAFAGAAGFVAACGGASSSKSGSGTSGSKTPATAVQSTSKTLNFYNWTDYIDRTTPSRTSRRRPGSRSRTTTTARTTSCWRRCRAATPGYDLIVPTDSTLVQMMHNNLLEPVDLTQDSERQRTSTLVSATPRTTPATSTRSRGSGARPVSATTRRR